MPDKRAGFWQGRALGSLSPQEWESLCDGCARCCLITLEDEDTGELHRTRVACRYLSLEDCRCTVYATRAQQQPDCIPLTADKIRDMDWMPPSCTYRLLAEGKPLPAWHPLLAGNHQQVPFVCSFAVSEQMVDDTEALQTFIIDDYES